MADGANGNSLADVSGKQYSLDFENRLTQAIVPDTPTTTFRYNPFGRRIKKSGPLETTNYLYDGLDLIEEIDLSGVVLAQYAQGSGIDAPLSELRNSNLVYYDQDAIGSVTSLGNGNGTLVNTYRYDTFGNLLTSAGAIPNPFRYTAREFDPDTQSYYYRARYYDPISGRFRSEDPTRFKSGTNFYNYVWNSAPNLSDPTGQFPPQKASRHHTQSRPSSIRRNVYR